MEEPPTRVGSASREVGVGLPETLEEAEALAASIERAVKRETGHGIRNLRVDVNPNGVLLRGRCTTYEKWETECLSFHLHSDIAHLVERRSYKPTQSDDIRIHLFGCFENFRGGDHHSKVDYLVVVAA